MCEAQKESPGEFGLDAADNAQESGRTAHATVVREKQMGSYAGVTGTIG
jgi:hypothetical protein